MRRKILRISPELLVAFLKDPAPPGISASGMPGDAKITFASWDERAVSLHVDSETFDLVERGAIVPDMMVTFSRAV